ncbi:TPA: hypothetical protein N0F65_004764 [Lagenidium giganteum]|uniref:ABC transporter domain-containing protein n=1 Tax=Lagenidium giganteum TaxID=4803 RepID=A0AAV2YT24_9STRA|nr:TPA: hypothetical protein N0F65_004764 [Lagenidium giganteum]
MPSAGDDNSNSGAKRAARLPPFLERPINDIHEHISTKVEAALGRAMPQLEIRCHQLSLSAELIVPAAVAAGNAASQYELPTLVNDVRQVGRSVFGKKNAVKKQILQNVSALFTPGSMTLVLGQPGSGKSAFMKTLSGRFPMGKNVRMEGDITFNGLDLDALGTRLPQFVAYVTQQDQHFPTLTVRETLEFAHVCSGESLPKQAEEQLRYGTHDENKLALDVSKSAFMHMVDLVLRQLGLTHCQDTVVGDAMLRGVSGGERKRVTTGEMEFGMKYATFMDEISTGLDSAATFDIVKSQRSLARQFGKTVVIALLQPAPEVFALFDNVILLNEGHVVYNGPCDRVVEYFSGLGIVCPPGRNVADFLLDVGTENQLKYETVGTTKPPRSADEYAHAFEQSELQMYLLDRLRAPQDPVLEQEIANFIDPTPEFSLPVGASTRLLMQRQWRIAMRNTPFLVGRALTTVLMGLFYGSVFYQFDSSNAQVVMGTIFTVVLFLALGQVAQLPTFIEARDVFYKQRRANFFRTASYVVSMSVSQVPLALAEAIVFGSITYWLCGFVSSASAFILFEVMLTLTSLAFAAWFFFLSCIAPNVHVAKPLGMVSILMFVLFAGFVLSKNQIPDYFVWIYWIDPIAWCIRALAVNQYRSDNFETCHAGNLNTCDTFGKTVGEYYLSLYDVPTDKQWVVYGLLYMALAYLVFMLICIYVLEYVRHEAPENVSPLTKKPEPWQQHVQSGTEPVDDYALLASPGPNVQIEIVHQRSRFASVKPIALAFKDLSYSVPAPGGAKGETIELLKGISGYALPGTMTALMGSSGAGKTTLMDVIAGRKTGQGQIGGQIFLNGHEATPLAIRRSTGYCEQMDVHSETATFREALTFSAFLRQSSDVSDAQKLDIVDECLELLDLTPIADKIIRGSSLEQFKRLTIGVELAAQPSVLFLDEPTSGLDARSAKLIMDGVRKVANTGRTVVCTIHQPSTDIFLLFDSLLLLRKGGQTVYFGQLGDQAQQLVQYLEAVPGVAPIELEHNPATWMLEAIGAGVRTNELAVDFADYFERSTLRTALTAALAQEGMTLPSPQGSPLTFSNKRAATAAVQTKLLFQRFFRMYWRMSSYNLTRIVISFVLGLLFGVVYVDSNYDTFQGINGGLGMIFLTTLFVGIVSFDSVVPIAYEERASFYRERACQTYNALWYFLAGTVVEIPYVFGSTFVFSCVFFPMVGFTGVSKFFAYWLTTAAHVLLQTYIGQFLAFASPSAEVASLFGVLFNSVCFTLMGFNPPTSAIPSGYKWLHHLVPHKYAFATLVAIVFGDNDCTPTSDNMACRLLHNVPASTGAPPTITISAYIDHTFSINKDDVWTNTIVILLAIVLFRVLGLVSLRYINHQKR